MAEKFFTREQVLKKLETARGGLSEARFAADLGIKQQALNDAVRGVRSIPDAALAYLDLEDAGELYRFKTKGKAK